MRQARDAEHLLHAAQHHRTVLTRDRDFLELHVALLDWAAAWGVSPAPEHAGILVIPSTWTVPFAASQINTFLLGNSRTSNTLYEYDAVRGWVRFR